MFGPIIVCNAVYTGDLDVKQPAVVNLRKKLQEERKRHQKREDDLKEKISVLNYKFYRVKLINFYFDIICDKLVHQKTQAIAVDFDRV
ncbi:UNKNOWN [Stylonychia lemnae]|uniref:Uncharacterized protein n=1 Tax=Stylonychia lemnae TaxID=5949 RepID=A0A078AB36_STYLE|nr:UNKNOWN [Stylonychia lemnae]|eukprot:CDW78003.1 UNKNOWN [Stylonychia lemnae]